MKKNQWVIEVGERVHLYAMHYRYPYELKRNGKVVKRGSSRTWDGAFYAGARARDRLIIKERKEQDKRAKADQIKNAQRSLESWAQNTSAGV